MSFRPHNILPRAYLSSERTRRPLLSKNPTAMVKEVCFSTTLFKFKPPVSLLSPASSLSLTAPLLLLHSQRNLSNSLLLSYSRHFFLPRHPYHINSTHFTALASPSAVDFNQDRLPADVEVTETEEPNSRVRLSVEVAAVVYENCYQRVMHEFTKLLAKVFLSCKT